MQRNINILDNDPLGCLRQWQGTAGVAQRTQGGGRHIRLADHHLPTLCPIVVCKFCAMAQFVQFLCNDTIAQCTEENYECAIIFVL